MRAALIAVTGVVVLAGCGATSQVDAGGFTAHDLEAGNAALALLAQTAVWTAASEVTGTNGNVPTRCSFHVAKTEPLTFELFITWSPDTASGPAPNRRYAWLSAVIGPAGLKSGYAFHLGYARTPQALASHYGEAFAKPAEKCLVEQTGTFALVPIDSQRPQGAPGQTAHF
jgi:hypothetical protein